MRPCLVDADAFQHLRTLSFLGAIRALPAPKPALLFTDYVARHELSALGVLIDELVHEGTAQIVSHRPTRPSLYFDLLKKGVDKGEASSIAWLKADATRAHPFVTCDRRAGDEVRAQGLIAWDIFELVVELLVAGDVLTTEAEARLGPWGDPRQQLGRPKDWTGFAATLAARTPRH